MAEVTPGKKPEIRGIMNSIREHTHLILWMLVFSFVGLIVLQWGMDILGLRSPVSRDVIAKVGRTEIKYSVYMTRVQNQYEAYRNQFGTAPEEATMRIIEEQIFQQMVNEILINKEIRKTELFATDDDVRIEVHYRPRPEFYNSSELKKPDGSFDESKYESILRQLSKNDLLFLEADARARIPQLKLNDMLLATIRVTEIEIQQAFLTSEQAATVEYIQVEPSRFANTSLPVTDQEITDYYKAHIKDFFENETRQLRYVAFSTESTADDSAEILKKSEESVKRAKAGEDFVALAHEYTESDGTLGTVAKGSMIPELEKEVFSEKVKKGDIIGPVKTLNGIYIFKIERIVKTKSKIDSIEAKQILFNFVASASTMQNAENKARLFMATAQEIGYDKAAQQEKVPIEDISPFAKSSITPGFGVNFDIERFAFRNEIKKGNKPISEPIQTSIGLCVFELSKVNTERTKTLKDEDVKAQIEDIIREQKQLQMGQNLLAQVKLAINAGTPFKEAAEKEGLTVKNAGPFKLNDYVADIGNDTEFNSTALGLDPGNVSEPLIGIKGAYLIRSITKDPFNQETYNAKRTELVANLLQQKQNTVFSNWIQKLRKETTITDYRDKFFLK